MGGLRSSGDFLCDITKTIFTEAQDVNLIQSIDDYLICATSMKDLTTQLKEVIRVAEKYGVVFNIEKIEVGSKLVYVGMQIKCRENGPPIISPDPKNIRALEAIPVPKNKKELRQFLGLANALAKYAPEHQRRAAPLYSAINSFNRPEFWTKELTAAFNDVKKYLSDPDNVLFPFDPELPVSLFTDASKVYGPGFSAILYNEPNKIDFNELNQSINSDKFRPLAMDSTFIPQSKLNMDTTVLEMSAIAWALEKFHHYTAGAPLVKVYCDSASTVNALKKDISQMNDPTQLKLIQIIGQYNIEPIFIPRSRNCHADLLSKHPLLPAAQLPPVILNAMDLSAPVCHVEIFNISSNLDVSVNTDIRLDLLEEQQQKDPVYQEIFEAVRAGTFEKDLHPDHPIKDLKLLMSGLHTIKNRRLLTYHSKVFIPKSAIPEVLIALHEGHSGVQRCQHAAKQSVFWPTMMQDIEKFILKCDTCKEFSNIRKPQVPSIQPFEKSIAALQPMQNVQMDIFEPKAGTCFLVMVDVATNFLFVEKIRTKSCKNIIEAMTSIFEHFGQH